MFVSYPFWPPDFGGELLAAIERFTGLAGVGCQVTVLSAGRPGLPSREVRDGLHILRSPVVGESRPARLLRRLVFLFWALARLASLEYDVLHYAQLAGLDPLSEALSGRVAAGIAHRRKARLVIVHSLADSDEIALDLSGRNGGARRRFLGSADAIVGVSPALYEGVARVFPRQARYIPYGIRDDLFVPLPPAERQSVRAEWGAGPDDVIFLFLGSLTRRKGFDLLVQAFSQLAPAHPGWRLWAIGPHNRLENQNLVDLEVQRLAAPVQNHPQVAFLGRVDERPRLARLLAAGDVFVFPTRREGMPISPMEAMSAGLPVILSRLPGITDQANLDGITGVYVPPNCVSELADAMQRLGGDAALRRGMGAAARQRIVQDFGWQQHLQRWLQLYDGQGQPGLVE